MQFNDNRESTMGIWACREKKLLQREHNETVQAGSDRNTSINSFHLYTEAISIQSMQSAHFHVHENCMRMMILFIQSYHIFFIHPVGMPLRMPFRMQGFNIVNSIFSSRHLKNLSNENFIIQEIVNNSE